MPNVKFQNNQSQDLGAKLTHLPGCVFVFEGFQAEHAVSVGSVFTISYCSPHISQRCGVVTWLGPGGFGVVTTGQLRKVILPGRKGEDSCNMLMKQLAICEKLGNAGVSDLGVKVRG